MIGLESVSIHSQLIAQGHRDRILNKLKSGRFNESSAIIVPITNLLITETMVMDPHLIRKYISVCWISLQILVCKYDRF